MKIIKENNNQFNEEDINKYFNYINEDIENNLFDSNMNELKENEESEKLLDIDKNNDKPIPNPNLILKNNIFMK